MGRKWKVKVVVTGVCFGSKVCNTSPIGLWANKGKSLDRGKYKNLLNVMNDIIKSRSMG